MAISQFYMQSGGSNLNSGSTNANAATYTSTSGNFDGVSIFTPTDSSTPASSVNIGDWASIYPTGNSTTPYVAQVTAVAAGVNGTITLSTTAKFGTAPISNSGSRNAKVGGAWADFAMVASGSALNTGTVTQSTCINVKAATYANTTTVRTFAMAGSVTALLWWRGYKTTIGDQDANNVAVAGTDIPTVTFTTANFNVTGVHQIFSNLDITSSSTTVVGLVAGASNCEYYRLRVRATGANAASKAANSSVSNSTFVACYFSATATAATVVSLAGNSNSMIGCVVTGGIIGVGLTFTSALVFGSVFDSQAGDAINVGTGIAVSIINNSIYAPAGHGVAITSSTSAIVLNNYFENVNQASKAGVANTSGTDTDIIRLIANGYFNCTSNTSAITESFSVFNNGTLSSAAFTAPTTDDFSIGTVAAAIGFPGTFENAAYQGYLDIGAVQRAAGGADPAGVTTLLARLTSGRATNLDHLDADISSRAAPLTGPIKKNTAFAGFTFFMALASDGKSPGLLKTITATRSLDGGAFAACANAAVEVTGGWYKITLAAADLNANSVALEFTAVACDPTRFNLVTTP